MLNGKHETNGDTKRTIPETVYKRHLARAQKLGNYFMFRRDYITSGILKSKTAALFLQDLINHSYMPETIRAKDDFFMCTIEYLYNSLRW